MTKWLDERSKMGLRKCSRYKNQCVCVDRKKGNRDISKSKAPDKSLDLRNETQIENAIHLLVETGEKKENQIAYARTLQCCGKN